MTIDAGSGTSSLVDAELPDSPDWTNAEAVIRKNWYIHDRLTITGHSNHTLELTGGSSYDIRAGYGYFIQGALATLDSFGEWYYDSGEGRLYVFFGAEGPGAHTVRVSAIDELVSLDAINNVTFDGLAFEGANLHAVQIRDSDNITIRNCSIDFTGGTAIFGPWWNTSPGASITDSVIDHSNNNAIDLHGDHTNATIARNVIRNTGVIIGMGESGDGTYRGISAIGDGSVIQYNRVEDTGYIGIHFGGNGTLVANNLVDRFNLVKNDGGGIYTYVGVDAPCSGQRVTDNIVMHGIGYGQGMPDPVLDAACIYMDDRVEGVTLSGNTLAYCSLAGIFLHNAHEITITDNTCFDNAGILDDSAQVLFVHDGYSPDDPIRNVSMTGNIFFARTAPQYVLAFSTPDGDIPQFGIADQNIYTRPVDEGATFRCWEAGWSGPAVNRTLSEWRAYSGQDLNSATAAISMASTDDVRLEYNDSGQDKVVTLTVPMIDVHGTKVSGSITLPPYGSAVLMVDPAP
jgi:parallel beta-helix repeat protein